MRRAYIHTHGALIWHLVLIELVNFYSSTTTIALNPCNTRPSDAGAKVSKDNTQRRHSCRSTD